MSATILIAAGGTGGHVFPALAVADAVRQRGGVVEWVASGGMEMQAVVGFPLHVVPFAAPKGMRGFFDLLVAVWRAWRVCRKRRPQAVLGMGGYASAPAGLAAKMAGVPLIIHEQNAVSGRANRLLAKVANKILCGFPNALPDGEWVGNPVRGEFFDGQVSSSLHSQAEDALPHSQESYPQQLLILGGSQGARALNRIVPLALSRLRGERDYVVVHQCGRGHVEETMAVYRQLGYEVVKRDFAVDSDSAFASGLQDEVTLRLDGQVICLRAFIGDVAGCMAAADFVICRAGAATLAELAIAGVPALLVPYPHAAAGHQLANAHFYAREGAAFVCEEGEFGDAWLADFLRKLTGSTLQQTASQLQMLSRPQAAATVAEICLQYAGGMSSTSSGNSTSSQSSQSSENSVMHKSSTSSQSSQSSESLASSQSSTSSQSPTSSQSSAMHKSLTSSVSSQSLAMRSQSSFCLHDSQSACAGGRHAA